MGVRLLVDKTALVQNYRKICEICGTEVIPVMKSNAYGLGILPVAGIFSDLGVKRLAVSRVYEAELLGNLGTGTEIILLSSTELPSDIERAVYSGATLACGSVRALELVDATANRLEKKVNVHLLIDTGFSHSGLREAEYEKAASLLPILKHVKVTGIFTQFSESHSKKPLFTELQNERFEKAEKLFSKRIGEKLLVHAANTCAALKYPETRYDAVRVGSGLLGRIPGGTTSESLQKIGELECDIAEIKLLDKGQYIGYSRQFRTKRPTKTALLHTGLTDGLADGKLPYARTPMRKLNDATKALFGIFGDERVYGRINGAKVPVIGRISQHCLALDVTDVECAVGDPVRFDVNPLFVPPNVERKYV